MLDPEHGERRTYRGFDYRSLLPTGTTTGGGGGAYVIDDDTDEGTQQSSAAIRCCVDVLPALSWRVRCVGCITCVLAGYLLGLGSLWRVRELLFRGNPIPFTVNATAGNLIALAGSFFLSGPLAQAQKMWHPVRRSATAAYLGSLLVTLILAVWGSRVPGQGLILLVLMGLQYVAIAWYTLSYVPYGQEAVMSFVQRWWNRNNTEY